MTALAVASLATATVRADYATEVQAGLRGLVASLPRTTQTATLVAPALADGGRLWLAGDPGFISEALGRAGGLMTIKHLAGPGDLRQGDVVLLGMLGERPTEAEEALVAAVFQRGAHVVCFGPGDAKLRGCHALSVPATVGAAPAGLRTTTPLLVAQLWTFTGEFVAALTRLGKMPPMWQSVLVPGGRERNEVHLKLEWEPGKPQPIAPGILGRTYLARVANCLRTFTRTQATGLREAARMAAATTKAGHTVWFACLGHLPPELPKQPGEPGLFRPLTMSTPEKLAEEIKPGDLILYLGYYEPYGPWVENAHTAGSQIVTIVSGTPERPAAAMGADLNLSGCWPFGDAIIELPGYDIRVLPASGFMQAVQYFMLIEAVREAGA